LTFLTSQDRQLVPLMHRRIGFGPSTDRQAKTHSVEIPVQLAEPHEVGGAVPQTAPILILTRHYSFGLLNFVMYSPGDRATRQKMPLCAPATNQTEGIVSVQNGGSRT
jgi:hypothetical protein